VTVEATGVCSLPQRRIANRPSTQQVAQLLALILAAAVAGAELWLFHWLFHRTDGHPIGRVLLVCGILAELLLMWRFTSLPRVFVVFGGMIVLEASMFHWSGHLASAGATYDVLRLINYLALFICVGTIVAWLVSIENARQKSLRGRVRR
jgi:hypothetical protein